MAVQTSYSENMRVALAGQIANMEASNLISRNVEDAAGIGFGLAVARGTSDTGIHAFTTGDTAILGITVRDRSVNPDTPSKYAQYESARVMLKGVVWVVASVAVNDGDPVYVIPATGAFAKTNASSAVLIANAQFDTTAGIGALAKVRLS